MDDCRGGSLQSEVCPVPIHAAVVSEPVGMAAQVELIIGLIEIPGAQRKFCLLVAFESRARHHAEHAVCPVAIVCSITASLGLQGIDVLWIDLRAQIARNVGVGNRYAVDKPADLMPASNMQLIVRDVSAR